MSSGHNSVRISAAISSSKEIAIMTFSWATVQCAICDSLASSRRNMGKITGICTLSTGRKASYPVIVNSAVHWVSIMHTSCLANNLSRFLRFQSNKLDSTRKSQNWSCPPLSNNRLRTYLGKTMRSNRMMFRMGKWCSTSPAPSIQFVLPCYKSRESRSPKISWGTERVLQMVVMHRCDYVQMQR